MNRSDPLQMDCKPRSLEKLSLVPLGPRPHWGQGEVGEVEVALVLEWRPLSQMAGKAGTRQQE